MYELIRRMVLGFFQWKKNRHYQKFKAGHVFPVRVNDLSFDISFEDFPINRQIVERIEGRREPETVAIIRSLLREGDKVLELGACYGYFTMNMVRSVGESGRVVSIEGSPNNFRVVKNNMERNGVRNVDVHNVFVDSSHESAGFRPDEYDPYGAIARLDKADGDAAPIKVPCVRISQFLKKLDFRPDYIFMDIEGFEVHVLEDLVSTGCLRDWGPTLVFETHECYYKPGKDLGYLCGLLDSQGYTRRRIAGNLLCFPRKSRT